MYTHHKITNLHSRNKSVKFSRNLYLFSYLENFSVLAINSFWNDKENSNFFKRNTMVFYLLSSEKNSLTDMANGHRIQMLLPLTNFPINNIKCIIFLQGKIVFLSFQIFPAVVYLPTRKTMIFLPQEIFIYFKSPALFWVRTILVRNFIKRKADMGVTIRHQSKKGNLFTRQR